MSSRTVPSPSRPPRAWKNHSSTSQQENYLPSQASVLVARRAVPAAVCTLQMSLHLNPPLPLRRPPPIFQWSSRGCCSKNRCIAENRFVFPTHFCSSHWNGQEDPEFNGPKSKKVLAEQFNQPKWHTHRQRCPVQHAVHKTRKQLRCHTAAVLQLWPKLGLRGQSLLLTLPLPP